MDKEDAHIVIAMANHNMNVTDVARAIFAHRNTVLYHLNKVKQQTGLDPRRFYDLVELVKMAQEVLESEEVQLTDFCSHAVLIVRGENESR